MRLINFLSQILFCATGSQQQCNFQHKRFADGREPPLNHRRANARRRHRRDFIDWPMTAEPTLRLRVQRVRDDSVILDSDLAALYGVSTKRFNEAFKRNRRRFPRDFVFQLTLEEFAALRSQIATSNTGRGGRRHLPWVFATECAAGHSSADKHRVCRGKQRCLLRARSSNGGQHPQQ
jgi:hypothetical protein